MTTNFYGNVVNQQGDGNVSQIGDHNSAAGTDPLAIFLQRADELRAHVSAAEAKSIRDSIDVLERGRTEESSTLRQALANITGIASLVGQVGAPVVGAVTGALAALGLS